MRTIHELDEKIELGVRAIRRWKIKAQKGEWNILNIITRLCVKVHAFELGISKCMCMKLVILSLSNEVGHKSKEAVH